MKRNLIARITIINAFFFYTLIISCSAKPTWDTFKLHNTTIYLGPTSFANIKDIHIKQIPLLMGENEQQVLNKKRNYSFSIGSIQIINPPAEKIYLSNDRILECWKHDVVMVAEPIIMMQDAGNPESLLYITKKINTRVSRKPIMLEFHGNFAQPAAIKDLKKCYDALFHCGNTQGYKSIALMPLKINISLDQIAQTAITAMKEFIEQHKENYASMYIILNSYPECAIYKDLLNRCINNTK